MTPRHALAAIAVAVIWGANFVVIDAGLHDMPPLTFVALRFVAVLVPAIFFVKRPDARWRDILLIGLFLSLGQFGLLYLSLDLGMPPGLASLVVQVQVIFTVVIAALALHERPTKRQQLGVLIGLVGLTVVALGRTADTPLLALMLCLAGALSWATGNVVTRQHLLKEVWGNAHKEDAHYLRIFVRKLRGKIEKDPARPAVLTTELGVGYRLMSDEG